jgi:hypothetical protein
MRSKGSVLVVVLGLLAILAVVGITFVTMSSIDRNTSSNFALNTQFDLAATGSVDYTCAILINDNWSNELKTDASGTTLFNRLLSDPSIMPGGPAAAANDIDNSTEPYDWPGTKTVVGSKTLTGDPWLCSGLDGDNTSPDWWSFKGATVYRYGLEFSGLSLRSSGVDVADNLGLGTNVGVWVPELAFPYEGGIIRVSLTIRDHAGMINLNAHGNQAGGSSNWNYSGTNNQTGMQDAIGQGYFISDVGMGSRVNSSGGASNILLGNNPGSRPYGRWGEALRPVGISADVFPENPALQVVGASLGLGKTNSFFTMDEEFELRRSSDYPNSKNPFYSRLRQLAPNIFTSPKDRLSYTTFGWTSMVVGDGLQSSHVIESSTNSYNWSRRKADINADPLGQIYEVMRDTGACPGNTGASNSSSWITQFLANIEGYRSATPGCGIKKVTISASGGGGASSAIAASRQPILSKILISKREHDSSAAPYKTTWTVQVQVMSPWKKDCVTQNDSDGLSTPDMKIETSTLNAAPAGSTCTVTSGADVTNPLTGPHIATLKVEVNDQAETMTLDKVIRNITLRRRNDAVAWNVKLDEVQWTELGTTMKDETNALYRPIGWEDEKRGANDPSPVLVVYVGPWKTGLGPGSINEYSSSQKSDTSLIPIRFPRSSPPSTDSAYNSNLPVRALADKSTFKAFARVGELNRVLSRMMPAVTETTSDTRRFWGTEAGDKLPGDPEAGQPPWLVRIANADWSKEPAPPFTTLSYTNPPAPFTKNLASFERHYKFDWRTMEPEVANSGLNNVPPDRKMIANVLTVGGPWNDRDLSSSSNPIDQDGDGVANLADWGTYENGTEHGRFGGTENRVMGLVNLNTASPMLLKAMEDSLDLKTGCLSGASGVTLLRTSAPITSPAMLVSSTSGASIVKAEVNTASPTAGPMEKEDEGFVRLSNIAVVRSDTFSVYGTVQFVTVTKGASAGTTNATIVRSRRFWALIDRSPMTAYGPPKQLTSFYANPLFIHPRVLNFQWLN